MGNNIKARRRMDGETAMAFAGDCFERIHPRNTWPEWLMRCTVSSFKEDGRQFLVRLGLTPRGSIKGFSYFEVLVDPMTANTTVLVDRDISVLNGSDYEGFENRVF